MKIGVSTFVTDQGIRPAPLGRALEERGFESLFIAEHSHIPVERRTPIRVAETCRRCTTAPSTPS